MTAAGRSPLAGQPAEFVGSFPDPRTALDPPLPEVALLGRSNVGKSSLLNRLLGRRNLARTSATPGKTTLMNVYRLPRFYLVDLPGYGFAQASHGSRAGYRTLLERYLRERDALRGVIWLLDSRREDPSTEDLEFQAVLEASGRPTLTVLTKADKLGTTARRARQRDLAARLGIAADALLVTSSTTGLGIADLGASIVAAVGGEEPQ